MLGIHPQGLFTQKIQASGVEMCLENANYTLTWDF